MVHCEHKSILTFVNRQEKPWHQSINNLITAVPKCSKYETNAFSFDCNSFPLWTDKIDIVLLLMNRISVSMYSNCLSNAFYHYQINHCLYQRPRWLAGCRYIPWLKLNKVKLHLVRNRNQRLIVFFVLTLLLSI